MRRRGGIAAAVAVFLAGAAPPSPACRSCRFERIATCGGFLEGPTITAAGLFRVVDLANGDLLEVKGGRCFRIANTGGRANGAKLAPDGTLFVADQQRGILRYAAGGFTVAVAPPPGAAGANDIAFDAKGGMYFTMPGASSYSVRTGRLYYLPPGSGGAPRLLHQGLAFPNGVTAAPDGRYVWVGQFADKTILALPAADNADAVKIDHVLAATSGGIGPDGMIVDRRRRLIWANFGGNSVGVAAADGTVLGTATLPADAGGLVTNIVEHDGAYFLTEAGKGEIWKLTGLEF